MRAVEWRERARAARDPRFDGRFFVGVLTTGIYCRPVCPAPPAAREHLRYFPSAAAAEAAGYRPCLRCRPERAPAAQRGLRDPLDVALAAIESGFLDVAEVPALARRVGLSTRHLRRLFAERLGASPLRLAQARRLRLAKRLIDDSDAAFGDIAAAAGYGSLRRMEAALGEAFGRTPTALRRLGGPRRQEPAPPLTIRLPARTPFAGNEVVSFLARRAIPGVEAIVDGSYRRAFADGSGHGVVEMRPLADPAGIELVIDGRGALPLTELVRAARRIFDLDAEPAAVAETLVRDPLLRGAVTGRPGLRVPGTFTAFELVFRAILGQQVSVPAARTVAARVVDSIRSGERPREADASLRPFPTPAALAGVDPRRLPLPQRRARTLVTVARGMAEGTLPERAAALPPALARVEGIGAWTCGYVAMRGGEDPDAWPDGDRVLCRRLGRNGGMTAAALRRRVERWRPWRAYGVLYAWSLPAAEEERR